MSVDIMNLIESLDYVLLGVPLQDSFLKPLLPTVILMVIWSLFSLMTAQPQQVTAEKIAFCIPFEKRVNWYGTVTVA